MSRRKVFWLFILLLVVFMAHRFTREIHIFTVSEEFERPTPVKVPQGLGSISAEECAICHEEIAKEWKTSIHADAWTDPYFQVDFEFDGSQQICLNCHTPLENQQENLVVGFRDSGKFDPILKPNPNFDKALQHEGVTCAVCHIENGVILGPYDIETDAHPVRQDSRFTDGRGVCERCHMVVNTRRDVFLKLPPCGNFAEIEEAGKKINCVKCHMPAVERSMAIGAPVRKGGRHLFRGGHDPDMVKKAVKVELREESVTGKSKKIYTVSITNVGTEHRLPTGTPDRHLKVSFRLFDANRNLIKEKSYFLQRIIMWRPIIMDLWDDRIKFQETRTYRFEFSRESKPAPAYLEAEVRYGLLREKQRVKIGYQNVDPISYSLFRKEIELL